jgi:hypothetical protein
LRHRIIEKLGRGMGAPLVITTDSCEVAAPH